PVAGIGIGARGAVTTADPRPRPPPPTVLPRRAVGDAARALLPCGLFWAKAGVLSQLPAETATGAAAPGSPEFYHVADASPPGSKMSRATVTKPVWPNISCSGRTAWA